MHHFTAGWIISGLVSKWRKWLRFVIANNWPTARPSQVDYGQ